MAINIKKTNGVGGVVLNGNYSESTVHNTSTDPHGVYVLANNEELYEIQRENNFEFVIDDSLNGALKAGTSGSADSDYVGNVQEVLRISTSGAFIPHFTQSAIEVNRGNNTIKFAGVPKFSSGTLTLVDYIGTDTKEALMAWQNKSYDIRTEKVGLVGDYKKTCWLYEFTPDYQEVRRWKIHGCWISSLSESDYSHDNNNKHNITATIEYDWAEIDRETSIKAYGGGGVNYMGTK